MTSSKTATLPPVANGAPAAAALEAGAEPGAAEDPGGDGGSVQQAQPEAIAVSRRQADGGDHTAAERDAAATEGGAGEATTVAAVEPASMPVSTAASADADADGEHSAASGAIDMAVDGVEPRQPPAKRAALGPDELVADTDGQTGPPFVLMSNN